MGGSDSDEDVMEDNPVEPQPATRDAPDAKISTGDTDGNAKNGSAPPDPSSSLTSETSSSTSSPQSTPSSLSSNKKPLQSTPGNSSSTEPSSRSDGKEEGNSATPMQTGDDREEQEQETRPKIVARFTVAFLDHVHDAWATVVTFSDGRRRDKEQIVKLQRVERAGASRDDPLIFSAVAEGIYPSRMTKGGRYLLDWRVEASTRENGPRIRENVVYRSYGGQNRRDVRKATALFMPGVARPGGSPVEVDASALVKDHFTRGKAFKASCNYRIDSFKQFARAYSLLLAQLSKYIPADQPIVHYTNQLRRLKAETLLEGEEVT